MSHKVSREFIDKVRDATSITGEISKSISLTASQSGQSATGKCPWCRAADSFHVHEARAFFHCFGCGEKGDVFGFLRKFRDETFMDVFTRLELQARIKADAAFMAARKKESDRFLDNVFAEATPYVSTLPRIRSSKILSDLSERFENNPSIAASIDHVLFADWETLENERVLYLAVGDQLLADRLLKYGERIATAFAAQIKRKDPDRNDDDRLPVRVVVRLLTYWAVTK